MDTATNHINSSWLSPDILYGFIDELREAGYNIGIAQYVAAQDLLLALAAQGETFARPERLKTLLGPIVCSSPAEQEDFQQRFSQWIKLVSYARLQADEVNQNTQVLSEELDALRWRSRRLGKILAAVSLALIGIFVPIIVWQPKEPPEINPSTEATPTPSPELSPLPSPETTPTPSPELSPLPSPEVVIETDFSDIPDNFWAQVAITELIDQNIISGYPDGTFRPDNSVTRAEVAMLFNRAFEIDADQSDINLIDTSQAYWAYNAINNVISSGFMQGYPENTFRPDASMTRAELITSIVSGLDLKYEETESNPLEQYLDRADIPDWARDSIAAAAQKGIIVDNPNSAQLRPNQPATRAEVAALLSQALSYRESLDPNIERFDWYFASIFCLLTLCIAFVIWRLWWIGRARLFLQRHSARGQLDLQTISIHPFEQNLFPTGFFIQIAQSLRYRVRVPSQQLDLTQTIESTLRQGGWFTPVYSDHQVLPEYLFLIDRTSYFDHQAKLIEEIIDRLKQNAVFVTAYFFDEDPRICFPFSKTDSPQRLNEVAAKYAQHRLVLSVEAEKLFNPATSKLKSWMRQITAWNERAILTPKPSRNWGHHELELMQQFVVLPATPEGIRALSQVFHHGKAIYTLSHEPRSPIPDMLRTRPYRWVNRNLSKPEQIDKMLDSLQQYLGEEGFYWFSACAVFPELHWNITLYLGNALKTTEGKSLLQVCSVTDLARLPWFRYGYMPDWLRGHIVSNLTQDQERTIRGALQELLVTAVQGSSGLTLEIAQQNRSFLSSFANPLLYRLSRQAAEDSPLRDYMFLSFMVRQPKLAIKATDNLNQLIHKQTDSLNRIAQTLKSPRWLIGLGATGVIALAFGASLRTLFSPSSDSTPTVLSPTSEPSVLPLPDTEQAAQAPLTIRPSAQDDLGVNLGDPELPLLLSIRAAASNMVVRSIAVSPDGQTVISADDEGEVQLWNLSTGNLLNTLDGFSSWVQAVAFSPDGQIAVGGSVDGRIGVWNLNESTVSEFQLSEGVYSLAFTPDGQTFASGHSNGIINIWDTSGTLIRAISATAGSVTAITFSPDAASFASRSFGFSDSDSDDEIRLWNLEGRLLATFNAGTSGGVNSIAISPDGETLAAYSPLDGETIKLWSLETQEEIATLDVGIINRPHALAFSPDGQHLAVGGFSNPIEIWDISTSEIIQTLPVANQVYALTYSPDGETLVSAGGDGIIEIWRVNGGKSGRGSKAGM